MLVCPSCGSRIPTASVVWVFVVSPAAAVAAREERRTVTIVFSDLQGSTKLGRPSTPSCSAW